MQAMDFLCTLQALCHSYSIEGLATKAGCIRKCNQKKCFWGFCGCFTSIFFSWQGSQAPLEKAASKNHLKNRIGLSILPFIFFYPSSPDSSLISETFGIEGLSSFDYLLRPSTHGSATCLGLGKTRYFKEQFSVIQFNLALVYFLTACA